MAALTAGSILWRRLDGPGHDACRLEQGAGGWTLDGAAVFRHRDVAAKLAYEVTCDRAWRTLAGRVDGWLGAERVRLSIARTADGQWKGGEEIASLPPALIDLDLGFTPATNLLPLRRLSLGIGDAADAPAAWVDVQTGRLEVLAQRYERRSETAYRYEAPEVGYAALLEVTAIGFVRRYPGLWEAV